MEKKKDFFFQQTGMPNERLYKIIYEELEFYSRSICVSRGKQNNGLIVLRSLQKNIFLSLVLFEYYRFIFLILM